MIELPPAPSEADFRLTAPSGFGDGWNHYAHSMAVFQGRVYVGTTRGAFAGLKFGITVPALNPWPIETPPGLYDIDRRAEIWEYEPVTAVWRLAFRSPTVTGVNGRPNVPSYIGYRGMNVFQDVNDSKPCLYISTWSPHLAHSPDVLRTEDGVNFTKIPRPPWSPAVRACRTFQPFKGRVHMSPTASGTAKGYNQDVGSEAVIYANGDLQNGKWTPANDEGFGDKNNVTIFEMGVYDDHLYAGVMNPVTGGELWKTPGGDLPYKWTRVFDRGAGRGPQNEGPGAMCEFKGAFYVACAIVNGGFHREYKIGPAAAEMLRIWPDDSWDLIVGEPRMTEQGLKVPLSGYSPGFDNIFNGYIWRMEVHEGWLYASTMSWAMLMPYLPLHAWPADVHGVIRRLGVDRLAETGGCQLWRTHDGVHWEPVTRNGFGNKYNWGIRTLASTPQGLMVGTANPFGPRVAVERDGAWGYVDNPRGGCELWIGKTGAREAATRG